MTARALAVRGSAFLALWIVLAGIAPADLAFGVLAALAAAWTSVRLLPPSTARVRPVALARYAARFAWQSVRGGWDVARRAFHPRLPLAPGFVALVPRLERGPARHFFASISSLLPGTVPVADEGERLRYHCLDTRAPVAAALAEEEAAFIRGVAGHEAAREAPRPGGPRP
jgi:multicomponent Na+:H+ antiporter subunit E